MTVTLKEVRAMLSFLFFLSRRRRRRHHRGRCHFIISSVRSLVFIQEHTSEQTESEKK